MCTTAHAGEPEIIALAFAMEVAIEVYIRQGWKKEFRRIARYANNNTSTKDVVRILFNGHNHYDVLLECK